MKCIRDENEDILVDTTLGDYVFWFPKRVQAWSGCPLWSTKDSLLGLSNSHFSSFFLWLVLHFFFVSHVKWNYFVQKNLYASKIFSFFTYKNENSKIYPMWAMFYQWPKFPNFSFFEIFYIVIGHLVLSHSYILCTLVSKVFVIRILSQKNCLDIPYESLNFFSSRDKILYCFPILGSWNFKTCSNLAYYAYNNTLIMFSAMKKIKLSTWTCH
jgi:hypothetical protein